MSFICNDDIMSDIDDIDEEDDIVYPQPLPMTQQMHVRENKPIATTVIGIRSKPVTVVTVGNVKSSSVPYFLLKLEIILKDHLDIVSWNSTGDNFIIYDRERFVRLLPLYYKITSFASFIRQLHLYSFKKVLNSKDIDIYENVNFKRDRPDLLKNIRRRSSHIVTKKILEDATDKFNNDIEEKNSIINILLERLTRIEKRLGMI